MANCSQILLGSFQSPNWPAGMQSWKFWTFGPLRHISSTSWAAGSDGSRLAAEFGIPHDHPKNSKIPRIPQSLSLSITISHRD